MRSGNVAAGVHHHHQSRADREWRDYTAAGPDYRAANRQHQEKRSDEFGDILVHASISSRDSLRKASRINNETLVLWDANNGAGKQTFATK